MTFLFCTRFVLNPFGDYEQLAFLQRHRDIAKLDAQLSSKDNEYLVSVGVRVDESVARRNTLDCEPVEGTALGNAGPGCEDQQRAHGRRPISYVRHTHSGRACTEFLLHLFDVFGVIDPFFTESARGTNISCYFNAPDGNSPEFDVVSRSEGPYFSRDTDDFLLIALWTFHMLFHTTPFMAQEPGPQVCWTNRPHTSKFFTFFA